MDRELPNPYLNRKGISELNPENIRNINGLMERFSGRNTVTCLFALIFIIGIGLRIHNLGKYGFWTDELFHVIGANSILEVGAPIVPGMLVYDRAYPYTKLISVCFKYFGMNEIVARIPSVIFNLLFILIGYFSIRYLFNPYLALIFMTVMMLSPLEIIWARECRMYALFQLMYFAASILFIIGFEPSIINNKFTNYRIFSGLEKKLDVNFLILSFSGFIFLLSIKIHRLVYNAVFVILFYCTVMIIISLIKRGGNSTVLSKYFLLILLFIVGGLVVIVRYPEYISGVSGFIDGKPFWDTRNLDYVYYLKYLFRDYPLLMMMYPAGVYIMIRKYGKIGVFMVCSFVPLMLLHCFIFVNNIDERYIFYIFPFFILCSASVIELISSKFFMQIQDTFSAGKHYTATLGVIFLLVFIGITGYPWVGHAMAITNHAVFDDWKSVENELKAVSRDGIIVSTRRMPLFYYMGRNPDYVMIKNFETLIREQQKMKLKNKPLYLDVKWLFNRNELSDLVYSSDNIYFVLDRDSFDNPAFIDDDVRAFILKEGELVKHDGDKKIIIYRMKHCIG